MSRNDWSESADELLVQLEAGLSKRARIAEHICAAATMMATLARLSGLTTLGFLLDMAATEADADAQWPRGSDSKPEP